jgi:acid stress chaperone HdeB
MIRSIVTAVAVLLGAASLPAAAQVNMEMNKITCDDWLNYDFGTQNFIQYWMSGYYNASKGVDVLDIKRLRTNAKKVVAYCKKHKSATLPLAIQQSAR